MPFQEEISHLRVDNSQILPFEETPIFIGTACMTKKVFSLAIDQSGIIQIPDADSGTQYRAKSFDGQIQYWKVLKTFSISGISNDGKEITFEDFTNLFSKIHNMELYCFIELKTSKEILFTSRINIKNFNFNNYTLSITLNDKIIDSINLSNITKDNYNFHIVSTAIYDIGSNYIEENSSIKIIVPNLYFFSNFNSVISCSYNFYYDIIDFRYSIIDNLNITNIEDINNRYSTIGIILNNVLTSNNKISYFTIPSNSIDNLNKVLSRILELGNDVGYFIVPLFNNEDIPNTLNNFIKRAEDDNLLFQAVISHATNDEKEVMSFSRAIQ